MAEYDERSTRRNKRKSDSRQIASGNQMYGHQGEAVYTGFSNRPLDVQSRRDDRILARILDDDFEDDEHEDTQTVEFAQATDQQELTPEDERQINRVFQAGIPTAIVGTYGTTVGTKVIWQSFAKVIVQRFGAVAAQALGLSAADGLLPVGEAIAFGLLAVTAWQIYRNWDELWAEAEKILVGQEPEPQIYTTPNREPGTIEHTGSAPPEVETGTPGYDTSSAPRTPNNTGHSRAEEPAVEYVFESETFDRDKIPGIHVPFRDYNREYPPNWELIKTAQNTNYKDTNYDCSEIAEVLLDAANGEGRIIEVTPNEGKLLDLFENGKISDEKFYYHQVYTDGKYVYDPRLDKDKAIPKGDWEKLMRGLNPDSNFKYLK